MVTFDLTEEAKNLLKLMYALYRCRREEGKGRTAANYFESTEHLQREYLPQMEYDDVYDLCRELALAGCINSIRADGAMLHISLSYDALVYGEQTFKRNTQELLEWVARLRGCLPC